MSRIPTPAALALALVFAAVSPGSAAEPSPSPSGKPQQLTSPDQVPEGLQKSDWASIREAHSAWEHGFQPVEGGWQARNPGQQWTTRFDGRGFLATPRTGGWTWGLELSTYGVGSSQLRVGKKAEAVRVDGQRLSYQWDDNLQEWWVNDTRGLEHGYTIGQRPGGDGAAKLELTMKTRGTLKPEVSGDRLGVLFQDGNGKTVLNYTGLKVWDADGRELSSHFEAVGEEELRLVVEDAGARYPLTIDPIAQQAYLKPAAVGTTQADDTFGWSVSVSSDTVVVGAPYEASSTTGINSTPNEGAYSAGAAYVFVRSGSTWSQQAYLKPAAVGTSQVFDLFGSSVAVSGDAVVVGAPYEDSLTTGINSQPNEGVTGVIDEKDAGAAYVFVRIGSAWSQQAYLKPAAVTRQHNNYFGDSVAVSGDTVVVGAPREDSSTTGINSTPNDWAGGAGAAYVFVRSGSTWSQQAYLKPAAVGTSQTGDAFGYSVSVSGDTVVVGAYGEASSTTGINSTPNEEAPESGAAYVFVRSGSTWSQQAYLKPAAVGTSQKGDCFGGSVSVSGDTVVVGARYEDSSTTGINSKPNESASAVVSPYRGAGAAYVFVRSGSTWSQQAYLKPAAVGTTQADDQFGRSVSVSGDTVVVGAPYEDSSTTGINSTPNEGASYAGAAYIFSMGEAPAVSTPTSTGITPSSATLGGSVDDQGGEAVTERGVVYAATSANADPQIDGVGVTRVPVAGTTGVFTVGVTGLSGQTGYSYRAYATNLYGTSYSSVATFTTLNNAPVANAQSVTTAEDTAKAITLSGSDVEGSTLSYTILINPAHGTLSGSGASRTYTPAANYSGADSFTFRVNDGSLNSATATVSITVTAVNDAPVANAQSVTTAEDTAKAITLSGSDVEGSTLSYTILINPAHGTLSGSGASRTYTPAANYSGADSFTFRVNDGSLNSATATVSITVTAVNDAPVANSQSVTTAEDTAKAITLSGSDAEGSALSYTILTNPAHGTLSGSGASRTYTPAANYSGADSFTFRVNDGSLNSAAATVSITVTAVNDAPVALDDAATTAGESVTIPVLTNDTDWDGDTLAVVSVTQGTAGTVTFTAADVTYLPGTLTVEDHFTYTVSDGKGGLASATVTVRPSVPVQSGGLAAGAGESGDPVPGEPEGTRLLGVGFPSIKAGGHQTFLATTGLGKTRRAMIISGKEARMLARQGDAATGPDGQPLPGVSFASFSEPLANDLGHTAFVANIAGAGVSRRRNDIGLWTDAFGALALVARVGLPAPGLEGAVLRSIDSVILSGDVDQGPLVAFTGTLGSGSGETVTKTNAAALWLTTAQGSELALRSGSLLEIAGQSLQVSRFSALGLTAGSPGHGRAAAGQAVVAKVDFTNKLEAVLYFSAGQVIELAAIEGQEPAALPGTSIASFGTPNLSSDGLIGGRVGLLAGVGGVTSGDKDVILLGNSERDFADLLARQGGEVPGPDGVALPGLAFLGLGDPVINGQGEAAFVGTLKGSGVAKANASGIWHGRPGDLRMIARAGDPAPGTLGGRFAAFTSIALPDSASGEAVMGPLFVASLSGVKSKAALYAVDGSGRIHLLAMAGGRFRVGTVEKTIKTLDVLPVVKGSYAQPRSYNAERELCFRLTFTDKTQRIVTMTVP